MEKLGGKTKKDRYTPKRMRNCHNENSMPKGPKIGLEISKRRLCNHVLVGKWEGKPINNELYSPRKRA